LSEGFEEQTDWSRNVWLVRSMTHQTQLSLIRLLCRRMTKKQSEKRGESICKKR
jgi:hypothetical protein